MTSKEQPVRDHIGNLLKDSKLSDGQLYQMTVPGMTDRYTVALQMAGETLYVSVSYKNPSEAWPNAEERYQLVYKKGESLGSEPKSVVIPK